MTLRHRWKGRSALFEDAGGSMPVAVAELGADGALEMELRERTPSPDLTEDLI